MNQSKNDKKTLGNTLYQVLKAWRKKEEPGKISPLTNLRCFRDLQLKFGDEEPPFLVAQQLIESALMDLGQHNARASGLIQQRFLKNMGIKELAPQLALSDSQYYKVQQEALDALTEVILQREEQALFNYQLTLNHRLEPLAQQHLFGVDTLLTQLNHKLVQEGVPWIVSVEGIGGVGKTSLADRTVRNLVASPRFFDMVWVSAKQQQFRLTLPNTSDKTEPRPALTVESLTDHILDQLQPGQPLTSSSADKRTALSRLLKQQPYLVVIDNLETMADYEALIPALSQWANPTKFLLTSRHSLRAYPDILCLNISELDWDDVTKLLFHEAKVRGLQTIEQAEPAQLFSIYEVVGGNPLALKLILGQIHALPLSQVLDSLRQAEGRQITELYTHIYWHSWQALSDAGRQALLSMPVAGPRGTTLDHLTAVSGLELAELRQALQELIAFSLVEVGGDLEERRYNIHRLTETFLLTEVTDWLSPD